MFFGLFFGAVMRFKSYVSYHLTPLYVCPEMAKTVSSALKKRMQGKSCFNFHAADEALLEGRTREIPGQELAVRKA
jgi:hypothetical protein